MAVALRELERTRRPAARLRVVPPPPPTPRWIYLVRRVAVLAVLAVVVATVAVAVRVGTAPDGAADGDGTVGLTVVIGPGETLWDVAARYAPEGRDRTAWAAEVADHNDVDAQALAPGTPVVVPVEAAAVTAVPAAGP